MNCNARSSSQSGDGSAGGDATLALDLFDESMTIANRYPNNIVFSRNYAYQLEEYARQLVDDRSKLFGNENIVDFLEFREDAGSSGKLNESLPILEYPSKIL